MSEPGKTVILKVGNGATSEVFTTLGGQQQTAWDGSTQSSDTTDKSNNGWQTVQVNTINGTVNVNGVAKWDAQLKRLWTQWLARDTVNCELIMNIEGDKLSGPFSITQMQVDGNVADAVKYNITLQAFSALTFTDAT